MDKTLVNFSGGVNSSLMLVWLLMTNPANSIIVHYCEIKNNMNGREVKTHVVLDMIKRLCAEGFEFEYIQTAVDISNIKFSYDLIHVINMASAICQTNRDISEVSFGFINPDDYGEYDPDKMLYVMGLDYDTDGIDIIYPMFEMNKDEIQNSIVAEGYSGIFNK